MVRHSVPALLALLALAGCGGSEARSVDEVARDYLASDDPAKCNDADLAFLEQQSKRKGDAARAACRRSVERTSPPKEVESRGSSVKGGRAEVRFLADGQAVTVLLRKVGERWLVTGFE